MIFMDATPKVEPPEVEQPAREVVHHHYRSTNVYYGGDYPPPPPAALVILAFMIGWLLYRYFTRGEE